MDFNLSKSHSSKSHLPQSHLSKFDLAGKNAVVLGVADRESIAWAIAKSLSQSGAKVVIGYQQKFFSRVRMLLEECPNISGMRCDIQNPDEIEIFFSQFKISARENPHSGIHSGLDILVHAIAFGPPSVFTQPPSQINTLDFSETMEVSAHSLAKVVSFAKPYLNPWASVITLTFQASQKAFPMYGMMGVAKAALESLVRYLAIELGKNKIRVNAISAGPVETLAALSEIITFKRNPEAVSEMPNILLSKILENIPSEAQSAEDEIVLAKRCWNQVQDEFANRSAIPEKLYSEDVADTALFFASDASKKITGQVLHVDCGFSSCQIL